jgi:hypothetical protein
MEWKDAINYFWGFTVCMVLICFGSSLPFPGLNTAAAVAEASTKRFGRKSFQMLLLQRRIESR